jgi:hypothetical protein
MSDEDTMRFQSAQSRLSASVQAEEYNLVKTLGLVPYKDGNAWCVLWGEDLAVGVSGFGDTPYLAVLAFNRAVCTARGAA